MTKCLGDRLIGRANEQCGIVQNLQNRAGLTRHPELEHRVILEPRLLASQRGIVRVGIGMAGSFDWIRKVHATLLRLDAADSRLGRGSDVSLQTEVMRASLPVPALNHRPAFAGTRARTSRRAPRI